MDANVKATGTEATKRADDWDGAMKAIRATIAGRVIGGEVRVIEALVGQLAEAEGYAAMYRAVSDFIAAGNAPTLADVREYTVARDVDFERSGYRSAAFIQGAHNARLSLLGEGWA